MLEQLELPHLVLHRVLHFGELQLHPPRLQCPVQLGQHVRRSDIDTGHRLSGNYHPLYWRWRRVYRRHHCVLELLGVGKEQRRVPAQQHQPWNTPGLWITLHVMVTAQPIRPAKHRVMRPPAVPQELDHRHHHGNADTGNGTEHCHADKAGERQPELPLLHAEDTLEVGKLEQPQCSGNHHRSQSAVGQVLHQIGRYQQQQGYRQAPMMPVSWVCEPAASATGVRDELLLIGMPWNSPEARLATPRPNISWLGFTRILRRAA